MFQIRRATPEDAQAIAHVHVESWRTTYRGIVPDAYLAALDLERRAGMWRSAASSTAILLVAELNGEIAGFACGGAIREPVQDCDSELYAIYLLEEAQNQGIGSSLLTELAKRLVQQGFRSLAVWVLEANASARFYEKTGAHRVAGKEIEIAGVELPEACYAWQSLQAILDRGN